MAILKSDKGYAGTFTKVLIPIGGKEINDSLKVRLIHSLYKGTGCQITLMTIIPPDAAKTQRKRAEEALQRAAKIYQIPQVELAVEVHDQAAGAIVARAGNHDLLVLGMREEPWFQSFFFGTVAQQVAGQVQCPTLLVKARAAERSGLKKRLSKVGAG